MADEELDFFEELRKYLNRRPFLPFVIVMQSGERYEITENTQVAVGRKAVVVVPPKSTHVFFPPHQISAIEVLEPVK